MIKAMNLQPVMPVGVPRPVQEQDLVSGFGEVLNRAVNAVSLRQAEAAQLSEGLVTGQHANIHETMIAVEQASISFKLMTKVHQKALDAYQEAMRIQL